MNPAKQRIAIAEACGLRGSRDAFPDYLNDLNAMHEAEQKLWAKDWAMRHNFVDALARILNPVHGYREQSGEALLDATAAQRAEAFLRATGKWEGDK